jgi:hypothetical protein
MEKDDTRYLNKNAMLEHVIQTKYGHHSMILYSELTNIEYSYLDYIKRSLESLNEIVLILVHHPVTNIINNLRNTGLDIDKYKKEGSAVVVQSKKAYYGLSQEFVGVTIMAKMLLRRVHKLEKAGLTVISDIISICAPYSFVCSCIIHLSMADVAKGDLTIKEEDKAVDRLVTSGYVMLYYAAAPLLHATNFFPSYSHKCLDMCI